ncbi:MAG: cardiolipin synthase [Chitinophagales bacterium]
MNWYLAGIIIYVIVLAAVLLRILFETHSSNKTLAYILLCLFVPVGGIIFYLLFGVNYWRKKRYSKKMRENFGVLKHLKSNVAQYDKVSINAGTLPAAENAELASMLIRDLGSPLTSSNEVKLLVNGEQKFPEVLKAIRQAKHHIHLQYYIYECDETGMSVIELLIEKAKQGVIVRFIYDDFGSPSIKKKLEKRMTNAGIEIFPFHKITFYLLANRLNYRNHRKIIIIDGHTAFTGGINVSDKYVNKEIPGKLYWRDTHMMMRGPAVYYLQYLFITDWKFCCGKDFVADDAYFADPGKTGSSCLVQIAAGGPDSPLPTILYSILQAIYLAKEEILITTPYFIPGDSLLDALCIAALSGLTVKLLVPGICDSKFVNAASKSYYSKLLDAGVEVYIYQKGFVHAKTMITDGRLSMIGTANMDYRSFDLNFEVNAVVYNTPFAQQMRNVFFNDLKDAEKIDKERWLSRSWSEQLPEKIARLFSPVL